VPATIDVFAFTRYQIFDAEVVENDYHPGRVAANWLTNSKLKELSWFSSNNF